MKNLKMFASVLTIVVVASACSIVRPGQVGVKQRLGKIVGKERPPGMYTINPFLSKIVKVPTRTINTLVSLESLPSKEGLSIDCELSILFHIEPQYAVQIVQTVGVKFGQGIIVSALRSAAADVSSQFFAKDMHTGEREVIEKAIAKKVTSILGDRGFVVEAVLLKSIKLPAQLSKAIEEKLTAEQEAQTMQFILQRQKQEAERQRIEAEGIRDSQKIIGEGLNDLVIKYKSLEVFRELSKSPNAKVIITDGKTPYLIND